MTLKPLAPRAPVQAARPQYSLLYVEDEDENWEVAELSLRDRYKLTRAKTAREAFSLLGGERFDAILMDIQLAGSDLDGIEITKALRAKPSDKVLPQYAVMTRASDIPIIYVTAYNARYSKDDLIKTGGDDMIPKPVDFTRLALAITRLILRGLGKAG